MKRIIVPTDFSENARNAMNYAADMAVSLHAGIALLHVCQLPASEIPVSGEVLDKWFSDAQKELDKLKADLLERTSGKIKVFDEVKTGFFLAELQDYCDQSKPYAVVMGTQGAGAIERFVFGSSTIGAMKHLGWPLIIVPPDAKFTEIRKIGLACDMKKVAATTPVDGIKSFVKELGASLVVIHINTGNDYKYGPAIVDQSSQLQAMLDELHPSYRFIEGDDIEEGLDEVARQGEIDLLIVVPKKHNMVESIFHRSQSKQIAMHTRVPVMSLHE